MESMIRAMSSWVAVASCELASAAVEVSSESVKHETLPIRLTRRHKIFRVQGNVLFDLDLIDMSQDLEAMTDTGHAHFFELRMMQCY